MNCKKDSEVSSSSEEKEQQQTFIQPKKTVRTPQKKKTKLITKLCHELGLSKILNDDKNAVKFTNAVTYTGDRSLKSHGGHNGT
ncbi:hypothetical protein ACJMK2_035234 [Sinanodonta woodiana]|uniref:Uncharacterized protein n=1 Tax=Sinanodonta woodiana TaxID=1069815 RepID=A0ABD3WXQ5_SINWO